MQTKTLNNEEVEETRTIATELAVRALNSLLTPQYLATRPLCFPFLFLSQA